MTVTYRIEIEVDGDQDAETNWENYAIDAMFEAFGTRKLDQITSLHGVDLTLDNSTYEGHVRMSGPYAPIDIDERIGEIATILRDGNLFDALAELANFRDALTGVRGIAS